MRKITALLAGLLLGGCASLQLSLPAVTESPTGQRQPGKIVWHDLVTADPASARRFYSELFGWEFVDAARFAGSSPAYTLIRHDGRLIGGMVDLNQIDTGDRDRGRLSQWVALMSVADLDKAVAAVTTHGGHVLTPPTDVAARGRLALVEDNQGAFIALLETRDGDPPDRVPGIGDFLWDELWASDVEQAAQFYSALTGLQPRQYALPDRAVYRYLEGGGVPRAGILPDPAEGLSPVWVSYLRVADPAAITARVAALGGHVLLAPRPRDLGGEVAVIMDPAGAGIALQTWQPGTGPGAEKGNGS